MPIPSEFQALIAQINQELDETEHQALQALDLLRQVMSRFPNNAVLIQFFAYFNAALFFVENSRRRIQTTVEELSTINIAAEVIQESGEDLAALLGEMLEAKIRGRNIITRLENLQ